MVSVAAHATPGPARAAAMRAAAVRGVAAAQLVYGQMLLDGVETVADPRGALAWFTRAAAQHDMMALNMVGRCYDLGWGTPIDKARAAACYRVAAASGLDWAMYNYATLLALGEGVAEDKAGALDWLEKAAAMGNAKAVNFVGSFAEDGWVHPRDMARAAHCYARAAAGGDFRGCFNHARMLAAEGRIDEALHWIGRAGALGNTRFVGQVRDWLAACPYPGLRSRGPAALTEGRPC